jgi:hypothetical protein
MTNKLTMLLILVLGVFLTAGNAFSNDFGKNITVDDGTYKGTGWYGNQEDQEVEPGCVGTQAWDLEAFILDGNKLTMVGGYDFLNGAFGDGKTFTSGDIFIDIDGDVKYGFVNNNDSKNGYDTIKNTLGYDYVLDLNSSLKTYDIYKIDSNSIVKSSYYNQNQASNPWTYCSDGTKLNSDPISMSYLTGLTDENLVNYGLVGGRHNAVQVNLDFLAPNTDFTVHFTMGCGNDNLIGKGSSVPEPAPMLLLGTGLIGLAGVCRKKFIKK